MNYPEKHGLLPPYPAREYLLALLHVRPVACLARRASQNACKKVKQRRVPSDSSRGLAFGLPGDAILGRADSSRFLVSTLEEKMVASPFLTIKRIG